MKTAIFIFSLSFLALISQAQNHFGLLQNARQTAQVQFTANPALSMGFDYLMRVEKVKIKGKPIGIGASLAFPLFSQSQLDIDVSLGASYLAEIKNNWHILSRLKYGFYHTEDINGRFFNHGLRLDLYPMYRKKTWAFAGHLALDYRPFVHITHKEYAKKAFQDLYPNNDGNYAMPQSGWFSQNLLFVNYGIAITYTKEKWNVNFTIDYARSLAKLGNVFMPDIGIIPFSANLGIGYRLAK
ncbi:MAG: hypothetical protein MUE81_12130 [Thermoflexibacter sp.]|jgi:hypothetical protein|nr:hypothetical protein [Thermoflexibacter sp.]